MNILDQKILNIELNTESAEKLKSGVRKSIRLEYKKHWKAKLMYPCGTFKKYDFVLVQDKAQIEGSRMLAEFKGINIVKEKKSWIKTKKYFEIELGNTIDEKKLNSLIE